MEDSPASTPVDIGAVLGTLETLYAGLRKEQKIGNTENPTLASLLQATEAIHDRITALQTRATDQPITLDDATDTVLEVPIGVPVLQAIQRRSAQTHTQLTALLSGAIERASDYDRSSRLKSLEAIGELSEGFQLQGDRFLANLGRMSGHSTRPRHASPDRTRVGEICRHVEECYGQETASMIPGLILLAHDDIDAIDRLSRVWCREGKEHVDPAHNPFNVLAKFVAIASDVSQDVITHSLHFGSHSPKSRIKDRSLQSAELHIGNVLQQIITSGELAMIEEIESEAVTDKLLTLLAEYKSPVSGVEKRHPWFWAENLGKSIYDPEQIPTLLTPEIPRALLAQILTDLNNLDAVQRGLVDVPNEIGRRSPQEDPEVNAEQYARTEALKRISPRMSLGEISIPPELGLRLFNFSLLQGGPTEASEHFARLIETLRRNHAGKGDKHLPLERVMLFRTLTTVFHREDRCLPLDLPLTATKYDGSTPRELLIQLCNAVFPADVIRGVERVNRLTPVDEVYSPPDSLRAGQESYFDSATVGPVREYYAEAARRWVDSLSGRYPDRFAVACRTLTRACTRYFGVEHIDPYTWLQKPQKPIGTRGQRYMTCPFPSATTGVQALLEQLEPNVDQRRVVMTNQEYPRLVGRKDQHIEKGGRVADLKIVSLWNDNEQRLRSAEELADALLAVIDDTTTLVIISSLTRFGEVPCGSVQGLGLALKIVRKKREGKRHVPILIDGAQALFRQRGVNQFNTLLPDLWLGSFTKIAGAGPGGLLSLRNGTTTGLDHGQTFDYDASTSTVPLEGLFILERLMRNASLRGCNTRHYSDAPTFGPDGTAQINEDENLDCLRELTRLTIDRASRHGARVWGEIKRRSTVEPEALARQLHTVWRKLIEQDASGNTQHTRMMLYHAGKQADRARGPDAAIQQQRLRTLENMTGVPHFKSLTDEQTDAFGSALFGANVLSPSHTNFESYGGIVTVYFPSISGMAIAAELPKYHSTKLAACGPRGRCTRFGLDDRQKSKAIGDLYEAIEKTQVHHALARIEHRGPQRAIFDLSAEGTKDQ